MKKTGKSAILSIVLVLLIYFLSKSNIFTSGEDVKHSNETSVQVAESSGKDVAVGKSAEETLDLNKAGDKKTGTSELGTGAEASFDYFEYEVDRVVDGDTIILLVDGKRERVRLSGVDTPESVGDYKDNPEFYGKEASAFTKESLEGISVYVEFDKKKCDKYDRLLAYIWTEKPNKNFNGFFNAKLIEKGYAKWYNDRENKKYAELFSELERKAKKQGIGLWTNQ